MPHSTFLFGNNTEALKFAEEMRWEEKDVSKIAVQLAKLPVCHNRKRIVVITQGPAQTILATNNGLTLFDPLPIRQHLVTDTTGAGDAFCGGFISHLLQNPRGATGEFSDTCLHDAIEKGHWAAREIIQRYGCSFPARCHFESWKKGIPESEYPRANA